MANRKTNEQPEFTRLERWLLFRHEVPDPPPELAQQVLAKLFTPPQLAAAQFERWCSIRPSSGSETNSSSEQSRLSKTPARHR